MKLFKKSFLSLFDWISLLISLGLIVFILLFVSLSKRNYTSLQSSIDNLSGSDETVKVLQNANRNLLLSENNFRIFLSTGDVEYKNKFLNYIHITIDQFKQIQQSGEKNRIDSIILVLGKNIEFSNMIEYLKKLADSVSNNAISRHIESYKGISLKKIDASMLEKYIRADTVTVHVDSSIYKKKRGFLERLFNGKKKKDDVKVSVTKSVKSDSANYQLKNSSVDHDINDEQKNKIDSLILNIQQFYKNSIATEMKARQEIASNDKNLAQNNLFIIDNIDAVLQQVINQIQKEDKLRKSKELKNAVKINLSNLKQVWWISATILFSVILLVISVVRIFRKTEEINIKNTILKKKNDISLRLISIINHDIITPLKFLNVVSKKLAEKDNVITQELKVQSINDIVNVSERVELFARNILNWMKYQNENGVQAKEDIDVKKLVDDMFLVLNPLSKQNNITLQNIISSNAIVHQYAGPLRIILYNLIINALKFSSNGVVTVSSHQTATGLIISVKDQGMGMTNEQIDNILNNEFITSSVDVNKNKGNGLGYLIIKDLLPLMKGKLSIQSKKNDGSIVSINIPYA